VSDWKEGFIDGASSVHSLDSDLMGFVKSAVESYAECAKVSSIHSTLISVSVNNLVLNIYRYKLLEFR